MIDRSIEPPCVFPAYRYREPLRMLDWLCAAFGFAVRAKYLDGDVLAHAELALGSSIIMVGRVRSDDYGRRVGAPGEGGGQSTYVATADVDRAFERAQKAGAKILQAPVDRDYGSREFICADPEGHVWSFGTYWPKAGEAAQ